MHVQVDSVNARSVRMENGGNNVRQVICSLFFFPFSLLVQLQTNALSPPPISTTYLTITFLRRPYIHHKTKYLEQLLESSLATVAVIRFSGGTLDIGEGGGNW